MRWASVLWVLLSYAIFLSNCGEITREKRSLSFIKKFLNSNLMGSRQKPCADKSSYRKPSNNYEIFVVPNRQYVVSDSVTDIEKQPESDPDISFPNTLRQFLTNATFRVTSKVLRGILSAILSGPTTTTTPEDDTTYDEVFEDEENLKDLSQNVLKDNEKRIPVEELSTPIINYKILNENPRMSGVVLPVVRFVSPIIEMPRKYSYKQIKGDTVEKFTLDENSDVIVTETRRNMPRPAYIDDRIKDVICGVPFSTKYTKIIDSNIHYEDEPNISTESYESNPQKNNIIINDRNDERSLKLPILNRNLLDKFESSSDDNDTKQNKDLLEQNNKVSQQNIGQLWSVVRSNNIGINNINLKTRYMYKQETNNGTIKYEDTSVVIEQPKKKNDSSLSQSDNLSLYTGEPIIVSSVDGSLKNINSFILNKDNVIYKELDESRGDIPSS